MDVLLVHGLGRSPLSMLPLLAPLKDAGHKVEFFGYAAFAESYEVIVCRLHQRLKSLSHAGDYAIIGHSLGGLLTRSALAHGELALPNHVFMLGTPNQSPRMARLAWQWLLPFRWFSRDCGQKLASVDWYATLAPPEFAYTTIAGTVGLTGDWSPFAEQTNDGLVGVDEVAISASERPFEVPSIHTLLMGNPQVQQAIVETLSRCEEDSDIFPQERFSDCNVCVAE
ncbi:MAG: alpha/beta hydrolase [Cyanobacteria bacterium P01_E01_bin.34]